MEGVDFSVIVATRNQSTILRSTLQAFRELDAADLIWELIVVDNGSTDATAAVLQDAATALPLRVLDQPVPGKNRALNRAIDEARGRLLLFTDDDIVPPPQWLQAYYRAARRWPEAGVFGGPIAPRFPPDTPGWIADPAFLYGSRAYGRLELQQGDGPTDSMLFGANLMIRACALEQFRFDESIGPSGSDYAQGGETELLVRLRRHGVHFAYVTDARVQHIVRQDQVTVEWLFGRAYRYGRGSARLEAGATGRLFRFWLDQLSLARAWMRLMVNRSRSDRARFAAGHRYHFLRGQLAERRRMRVSRRPAH